MKKLLLIIPILIIILLFIFRPSAPAPAQTVQPAAVQKTMPFAYPVANFKEGITKKPFGIYITPKTSPVQPERFTGYHTGVDIEESQNNSVEISVFAIADGEVVYSGWVSGYGGVLGLKFDKYFALYGHLLVTSLPKVGAKVTKGEKVGVLGKGNTSETDFERRHLHFGIITSSTFDLRGYVQTKSELSNWLDPVIFFEAAK